MNINKIMDDAKKFADDNLADCCRDLVEWSEKSVLPNGKFRELSLLLSTISGTRSNAVAEGIVKMAAYRKVVNI